MHEIPNPPKKHPQAIYTSRLLKFPALPKMIWIYIYSSSYAKDQFILL
jgi:hypothetical protein